MELLPADLESKEPIASSSAAASVAIITKEPKLATPAVPDESVVIAGVSALAFLAELNNGMFVSFLVGDFLGRGVTQESVGVLFGLSAIGVLVVGPFGPRVISALGGAPATMRLAALALAASSFGLAGLSLVSDPFTLLVSAAVFFALKSVASVLSELGGGTTVMCAVPEARRTAANGQFMAAKATRPARVHAFRVGKQREVATCRSRKGPHSEKERGCFVISHPRTQVTTGLGGCSSSLSRVPLPGGALRWTDRQTVLIGTRTHTPRQS